ncbi:MAG: TIGR02266 family protein [Myxococcales bacterium]|nr:TIGR02266 family protein [Myxococcales bacterium]
MAGHDSRIGDRQSASMRIKLKYPDVETFIQKYAVNISRGGIFIATKQPKPVGTFVKFEFLLSDASTTSIIRGEGQVQWTKEFDPAHPMKAHGMGVKFSRLDAGSQAVIDRALRWRADHGTNPGAPIPIPTSSAHTIATRNDSQADRLPERDAAAEPTREPPIETFASPAEETTVPSLEPPVRSAETNEPLPPMPPGRGETRPIAIDHVDDDMQGRPSSVETRPIPISMRAAARTRPGDEIDALVSEWGLSEEKLAKILNRSRGRVGVEATAELERLLLKPPKLPVPTKAEALRQLAALLAKKNGKNGKH